MSNFLKFACIITGDEPALLERSTPESRKKVKALAVAVLVPVLIWGGSSFLLSYTVLHAAWWKSLMVALVVTLIVFTLERLIIMAKGNSKLLAGFRIAIGLCTALLGAVIIDDLLFADAINQQLEVVKHEYAIDAGQRKAEALRVSTRFDEKHIALEKLHSEWNIIHEGVLKEADGTGGSGRAGVDGITKFKMDDANRLKQEYEQEKAKMEAMENEMLDAEQLATEAALTQFNPNNLLYRIKALFQLVSSDGMMLAVYIVFTLLMFLMEFLVIIFKSTWEKSAYEYQSEALENLHKARTNRLYGPQSPQLQPHNLYPEIQTASRNISSSLNTLL